MRPRHSSPLSSSSNGDIAFSASPSAEFESSSIISDEIAQLAKRGRDRRPVQQRRYEDEEEHFRVAVDARQPRDERECEPADYEQRRIRNREPVRQDLERTGDG